MSSNGTYICGKLRVDKKILPKKLFERSLEIERRFGQEMKLHSYVSGKIKRYVDNLK